ncbi:MAG TPA: DEAD/DEAH box helicase [Candidatus Binatia bacterium]|nr:DEAD/DEAH box helicase [Candidatus Binatia bacterium]
MTFSELGLAPEIARAVLEKGYEAPTPIQAGTIPGVLSGKDLIGCAQTGTGKTAAFTLPILHRLRAGTRGKLRALILTPTRELALQITDSLKAYGRHVHLDTAVVHGGVGHQPQESKLRRGVDILVATPGRLLDHMGRGYVDFRALEVLVLDEADRMLDMGFIRDVRRIVAALPARRQTLMFSATMPDEIRRLSKEILRDPVNVEVAPRRSAPAAGVRQTLLPVDTSRKRELMAHLLETEARGLTLVFTRTKHGANKLARHLEGRGHSVALLHGNRSQSQRNQALAAFKGKRARVMVATDIAGRGIDVEGIAHVVNYDLPNVPEDYVHRIGRTARAGASGDALSLVSPEDHPHVRGIETLIGAKIERRVVQGFAETKAASQPLGQGAPAWARPVSNHSRPKGAGAHPRHMGGGGPARHMGSGAPARHMGSNAPARPMGGGAPARQAAPVARPNFSGSGAQAQPANGSDSSSRQNHAWRGRGTRRH